MAIVLVDALTLVQTATADAGGAATCTFDKPPAGQFFYLERIAVSTTDGSGTTAKVYIGDDSTEGNLHAGTTSPGRDFDDEPAPGALVDGAQVNIVFAGVTAAAQCIARAQVAVWERV